MNPTQTTKSRPPVLPSLSSLFKSTVKKNALGSEDPAFEQVHPHSSRANLKTEERLDISPELQKQEDRIMTQESSKKKKNVVFNEEREYLKTPPIKKDDREITKINEKPAKKGILVRKRLYSDHGIPVGKDSTAENSQISNASVLFGEEKTKEVTKELTKEINREERRPASPMLVNTSSEFPGLINSFAEAFDRPRSDSVDKIRPHMPSTPDILDQTAAFRNLTGRHAPSIFKPAFTKNDAVSLFKGSPRTEEGKIFSEIKSQSIKSSFFSVKDKEPISNNSTLFSLKDTAPPAFNVSTRKDDQALSKLLALGPNSNEPRTAKEIFAQIKAERNEYEKLQKVIETPYDGLSIKHKKSNSLSEGVRSNFALAANSILKPDQFKLPHIAPFTQKPTLISSFQVSTPNSQYMGTPKKV